MADSPGDDVTVTIDKAFAALTAVQYTGNVTRDRRLFGDDRDGALRRHSVSIQNIRQLTCGLFSCGQERPQSRPSDWEGPLHADRWKETRAARWSSPPTLRVPRSRGPSESEYSASRTSCAETASFWARRRTTGAPNAR